MRRFHRWFGLITGVFLALIAATGIAMQVIDLTSPDQDGPPHGAGAPALPVGGVPNLHGGGGLNLRGIIDHIHDGEFLGNTGRIISLILGLAVFFFAVSGIYMYLQMFNARKRNGQNGVFW